jgi:hypothetical protein
MCHHPVLIPWTEPHYCLLPLPLPQMSESQLQLLQDLAVCLAQSELQVPLLIESLQPWKAVKIPQVTHLQMEGKRSQEQARSLLDNLDWKSEPSFLSKKGHYTTTPVHCGCPFSQGLAAHTVGSMCRASLWSKPATYSINIINIGH